MLASRPLGALHGCLSDQPLLVSHYALCRCQPPRWQDENHLSLYGRVAHFNDLTCVGVRLDSVRMAGRQRLSLRYEWLSSSRCGSGLTYAGGLRTLRDISACYMKASPYNSGCKQRTLKPGEEWNSPGATHIQAHGSLQGLTVIGHHVRTAR